MNRLIGNVITVAVALSVATTAAAQSKTFTKEQRTVTATIEAIDQSTRRVTLKKSNGDHVEIQAPADIKRFSTLKPGDTITARYYENVVLFVKDAGEAPIDKEVAARTPASSGNAGTIATQRTITATVDAIDLTAPSISFVGPNGWRYTSPVQDVKALKQVKVGTKVDIVWTDALLLSVETPKAK